MPRRMVFSIAPPISAHLRTQGCTLHDIGTISVTRFGPQVVKPSHLCTFWTIAVYVGEIIRRAALDNKYRWVTIGEDAVPAGHHPRRAGIAAIRGLRAKDRDLSMPSLAVARIVLRGSKVPSIGSYVRRAIGLHA